MTLSGFVRHDWNNLCCKLCKEYISPTTQGRFSKQKLVELTNWSAGLPMEEETDVINYHCKFNLLSKPLLEAGQITTGKRNTFFWCGFHPKDHLALWEHFIAKQPDRPKGQAFDLQDVLDMAIAIFSGDDDLLFQEPPPQRHETDCAQEWRTGHTTQGSWGMGCDRHTARCKQYCEPSPFKDQELDDQEALGLEDYDYLNQGHRHLSACIEARSVWFKDTPCKEEQKMEDLIQQLYSLSVQDLSYAILYAWCAMHFLSAMMSIPKLEYRTRTTATTYLYQTMAPPPPPPQLWNMHTTPPPPLPQSWSAYIVPPTPILAPAIINASTGPSYYHLGPHPKVCSFCFGPGHRIHECPIGDKYSRSGHTTIINGWLHLPNRQPIPYDGTRQGIWASIDSWLAAQAAPMPTTAQTCVVFVQEPLPHIDTCSVPTSWIEEGVKTYILQVKETATIKEGQEFLHDILKVFAAKRKCNDKKGKASKLSATSTEPQAHPATSSNLQPNVQYWYTSNAEDQCLVTKLEDYLMQGKFSLMTPAHVFAASPAIHKDIVNKLKVWHVEANKYKAVSVVNLFLSKARIARAITVCDNNSPNYPSN